MTGIRDRRNSVLATVTGISVAIAGVLVFTRTGLHEAGTADGGTKAAPAAAVRGPGIPPAPGSTQNAPPDPNPGAPTANLKKAANALRLKYKSVTVALLVPAGLGLTNRVDVSLRYGSQGEHITQTYNNQSGNRLL